MRRLSETSNPPAKSIQVNKWLISFTDSFGVQDKIKVAKKKA